MFRADAYLRELQIHRPEMLAAARRSMEAAVVKGNQIVPDSDQFAACPSDSIDYAIMEKAERVAVVPVSMGWSDVGSWDSLYALRECDEVGNARSEEHTSELQSLMRISYAVFCLQKKKHQEHLPNLHISNMHLQE